MELSQKEMMSCLNPLMMENEKPLCPVYASIKQKSVHIRSSTGLYAYVTYTDKNRLVLYLFDQFSSHSEIYLMSDLLTGNVEQLSQGQYLIELSFITDVGSVDINMTIFPEVKNRDFPKQKKNLNLFAKLLNAVLNI